MSQKFSMCRKFMSKISKINEIQKIFDKEKSGDELLMIGKKSVRISN